MKLFIFFSFLLLISTTKSLKSLDNLFLENKTPTFDGLTNNAFNDEESINSGDLISNIEDFVDTPEGGISWDIFGETDINEYNIIDDEGTEWIGVRPKFKNELKKLEGKEILIQGYMFPLDQSEKQKLFLLGPFPVSCPYHFHTTANLIIEVHAKNPILFSYDPVNIKGRLELVEKDDEYNIFFRMTDSKLDG